MTNTDPWKVDETLFPASGSIPDRLRFLLQYAVLAPSSHNTQPWKFRIDGRCVDLFMDEERWLKVSDDDQRELHLSVGCCLENLLVAADHFGFDYPIKYLPDSSNAMHAATVEFMDGAATERDSTLFQMITVRHTNHGEYDGRPIPEDILDQLSGCYNEPEIQVRLTSDHSIKQKVDELVVRADAMEFADPAFREELGYWISQGVFGTSWLMSKIGKLAVTHINMGSSTAKKDSAVLMSSPVLGLISSKDNSRETQIKSVSSLLTIFCSITLPLSEFNDELPAQSRIRSRQHSRHRPQRNGGGGADGGAVGGSSSAGGCVARTDDRPPGRTGLAMLLPLRADPGRPDFGNTESQRTRRGEPEICKRPGSTATARLPSLNSPPTGRPSIVTWSSAESH